MSDKGDRSNEMSEAVSFKIDDAHVGIDFIRRALQLS